MSHRSNITECVFKKVNNYDYNIFTFLGVLFGVAAIGCAVIAVHNMLSAVAFPKSIEDEVWPYTKKSYIFLGLVILFVVIGGILATLS